MSYGYMNNTLTANATVSWGNTNTAIQAFESLYTDPMWREYEAAGKVTLTWTASSNKVLQFNVAFNSIEAGNEYLQDGRIYSVKVPLLNNGWRLDWNCLTPAGNTMGGTFE